MGDLIGALAGYIGSKDSRVTKFCLEGSAPVAGILHAWPRNLVCLLETDVRWDVCGR